MPCHESARCAEDIKGDDLTSKGEDITFLRPPDTVWISPSYLLITFVSDEAPFRENVTYRRLILASTCVGVWHCISVDNAREAKIAQLHNEAVVADFGINEN